MRKEPLIVSILKLLIFAAIAGLLAMLYWSSLLVERDLHALKNSVSLLLEKVGRAPQWPHALPMPSSHDASQVKSHIDEKLPNLLGADPFFEKTLPAMLGPDFQPYGVRKTATYGKPDNLHPFANWADVSRWRALCTTAVSKNKFGYFETYAVNAAIKAEERPLPDNKAVEYWVHLRNDLFWQPLEQNWFSADIRLAPHFLRKIPVTAHDFKFWYDLIMNPFITESLAVTLRQYYSDIEEVRVIDDHTFVVRWKTFPVKLNSTTEMRPKYLAKNITLGFTPLARFVYQYYPDGTKIVEDDSDPETYRTNSTFAQLFMQHWAKNVIPSCGPMVFQGMSDQFIKFKRNPDYFDPLACLVEGLHVDFRASEDVIWQAFKQGMLDNYALQPDQQLEAENFLKTAAYQAQAKRKLAINRLDYLGRLYTYIGWNQARPLFQSTKVRQALTMAINRPRIIKQILNGMGMELACPFYPFSDAYDSEMKPWPYDPREAKRLLEEEGFFDYDGDGVLSKKTATGDLKFSFALTYYVKNPTTKAVCEYVSTALKEIGIQCRLRGVDVADLSLLFDDKNFDAYFLAWVLSDPPEDPRQLWHSSGAKERGSSNSIGFMNREVDQIIEALTYEYDPEKRKELYHRFCAIIHEECPYTLLYVPRVAMLYREYLQNVFLPIDRQDILPGANVAEPDPNIFWIKK
jgi:peptide/nickel transport system substrate-binding protein